MQTIQIIPDGIYYLVLADLVGSTKFGAKMGNAALAARVNAFVEASKKALDYARSSGSSGHFLKAVGDGVLIVFNHFPDIVHWRMEFDGELDTATQHHEPMETRICVHAGETRFDGGDANTLAINQLFKMEKNVRAGDLVLTNIAHELALPSLYPKQCIFEEYGTARLDGYSRPVKLHRLHVKADIAFLIERTARGQARREDQETT